MTTVLASMVAFALIGCEQGSKPAENKTTTVESSDKMDDGVKTDETIIKKADDANTSGEGQQQQQ